MTWLHLSSEASGNDVVIFFLSVIKRASIATVNPPTQILNDSKH